jgi:hypothetical protein
MLAVKLRLAKFSAILLSALILAQELTRPISAEIAGLSGF